MPRARGDAPALLLDRVLAHDDSGSVAKRRVPDRRKGILELDHSVQRVDDLDAVHRVVLDVPLRLLHALEGILDVLCRHVAEALRPLEPRAQRELDVEVVGVLDRGHVVRRTPAPLSPGVVVGENRQAPELHRHLGAAEHVARVQRLELARHPHRHALPVLRPDDRGQHAAPGHRAGRLQESSSTDVSHDLLLAAHGVATRF